MDAIFMNEFSHLDKAGEVQMVDVSHKPALMREAIAIGSIHLQAQTILKIDSNQIAKGNVLATARLAGIMAAKKTAELIPLCHSLPLSHCEVEFEIDRATQSLKIRASAKTIAQTGVEMEALTAVTVAALTIYDMCKAVDKTMTISDVKLLSKTKRAVE
jgi:cyclic pyranopterin phosphate synthase